LYDRFNFASHVPLLHFDPLVAYYSTDLEKSIA